MKFALKIILIGSLYLITLKDTLGQTQKRVSTYLLAQYNRTIYDRTIGNNPAGFGLGLQAIVNSQTKIKLLIDLTGDLYLANDKVARLNSDGTIASEVRSLINGFAGPVFHPLPTMYVSLVGGASLVNGQPRAGLKPSVGFYFSESHRWTGKLSYVHLFNRDQVTNQDFGSLSVALGFRLF